MSRNVTILSAGVALATCLTFSSRVTATPISVLATQSVAFDNFSLATSLSTPLADDTMLVVGFTSASENFVDIVPTSLTFGGQDLLYAGGISQNVFTDWYTRTDVYYLPNPPPGLQPLNGSVNNARPSGFRQEAAWGMHAIVLGGVVPEAPIIRFAAPQNPNAPSPFLGGTINTATPDSMLVGFAALNADLSGNRLSSNDGVTDFADASTNILYYGAGYKAAPIAGSNPYTWITNGFSTGIGTTVVAELRSIPEPCSLAILLLSAAAIRRR